MITRAEWDSYTDEEKWIFASTTDQLLEADDKVLRLIPECPRHGYCLPHYSDWIKARLEPINQEQTSKAS